MNKRSRHSKDIRKRRLLISQKAAARTLNGNGSSPDLPPLPIDDDEGSLGTLFSHKYGALPFGNIYMAESSANQDQVRKNALGCHLATLNDEQIISLLQYLDGESLSKVVQCSRYLYVAGHHDDLWRDITLRKYGSKGFDFVKSWKDTFISSELKSNNNMNQEYEFKPHHPIKMKNIYSDIFFRSWLCGSFTIHKSWISTNNICTEDSKTLTIDKFLEYEERNIPLLIKGATLEWPAIKKWNRDYLQNETKGFDFRATSGAAPLPAKFSISQYLRYCDDVCEEAPLYLFDRTFAEKVPTLLNDYLYALKDTCPFFDDKAEHGHDLFSILGKDRRPDHRWIIIGPKRSFSNFHIDPNATHAWNAPIIGRKRWIFYPPGVPPPGVYPSPNGDDVVMPISLGEWFLTHFNDHLKQRRNEDKSKRPIECTVEPGDILFVPHGWWHSVLNLDDGMSVAITQNYVSKSNLPDVLRFLETRQQQISGCRDRPEAVKPEDLLHQFRSCLRESRPILLDQAQSLANDGWHCAAWDDDAEYTMKRKAESHGHKKKKTKTGVNRSIVEQARTPTFLDGIHKPCHSGALENTGFTFSFL